MKKLKKVIICILIALFVIGILVFFDYFYTKTNNSAPKISLKEELDENTTVYKAIFYRVWYCKSNKSYYIGSYSDKDAICPKNYSYDNGYYTNELGVKISKRDLQLLTNDGIYTSDMIEQLQNDIQVENAVYVAYNYGLTKYKEEDNKKSSDGYKLVLVPEFKEVDEDFKWVYDETKESCLKTDKTDSYLGTYVEGQCKDFKKIKMDKKWCENYTNSTLVNEENIEGLCKE